MSGSSSALGSRLLGQLADLEELFAEFPLAKAAWNRRREIELFAGDVLFLPAFGHIAQRHCNMGQRKPASASTSSFFIRKGCIFMIEKTFGQIGIFFLHNRLQRSSKRRSYLSFQNFQECPDPSTARSWLRDWKNWLPEAIRGTWRTLENY